MDQSNSNQSSNQHKHQDQDQNSSRNQAAPIPTKPLKVKGKYTPKNQAVHTSATSQQQPIHNQAFPFESASMQGDGGSAQHSAYGTNPYSEQPQPFYGVPPVPPQNGKLKHGGLGISSFIIAIVSLLAIVIGFIVMFSSIINVSESDLLMLQDPQQIESMLLSSEAIPSFILSIVIGGLLLMLSAFLGFIGFILGVISLFIKNRRKVFGILGTVFNGLICFGGLIFMFISFLSAFSI